MLTLLKENGEKGKLMYSDSCAFLCVLCTPVDHNALKACFLHKGDVKVKHNQSLFYILNKTNFTVGIIFVVDQSINYF